MIQNKKYYSILGAFQIKICLNKLKYTQDVHLINN